MGYSAGFLQELYQFAPGRTEMSIPRGSECSGKILTCDVAAIIRNIRKVQRHLNFRELLRRDGDSIQITSPDLDACLEVKDERVQVGELQRYEV